MGTSLQIAVVGSGYWGKNLVRNYYDLGALRLICDKNVVTLSSFKKMYPNVETCVALNEVLSDKEIHGVVIATPAETHFVVAREALLAGKHVYVEKPLVLHEQEAIDLIEIAEKNNLILMVGHLLQYHPVFRRLKELANSGELGRINYIYSHRLNLGKIRREENILWSFAPHDISMILSLAGEEPEQVFATGGNYLHKKIADVTTTHLEFSSGLKAHIFVSWLHPYKEQKLVVVGDRKMAVFDDTQPWKDKLLLYPHEIKWQNHVPIASKAQPERPERIEEKEPLRIECEHFLKCISDNKKPLTDGREGLRVLRVLNASQTSIDQGGKIIPLNKDKTSLFLAPESTGDKKFFVHESTYVDNDVEIGEGTRIWHFSHILKGSKIGKNCRIGQNVVVGPNVNIGNGCKIQNNVSIYEGVTLEDNVFCGPSMVFTNVYNPRAEIPRMKELRPTLVKKGATLGANSTIVCGITIGRYAFIAAGAVVTRDVPDYALVMGNPGRVVGWMCRCGNRLTFKENESVCKSCGKEYKLVENGKGITEVARN